MIETGNQHRPLDEEANRQRPGLLRSIVARNIAFKFLSELVARGIQIAFVIVAARWLGPRVFGSYSYAVALGFILAQFTDLGLQLYVTRELSRSPDRGAQILGAALRCKLALLAAGLLFLLAFVWRREGAAEKDILFLIALAVMLTSLLDFFNYAFRGYQRLAFEAGLNLTARVLGPGVAIPCLLLGASLRLVAWNLLLANVAAAALGYSWLIRHFARPDWRAAKTEDWGALAQVLPLGIAILASALYTRMGILMLTRWSSLEAAGWLNAAQRVIEPLLILPAIGLAAIFPAFAGQGDDRMQRLYARRTLTSLLGISLAAAAAGWLGAERIIGTLYGPGFRPSTGALRWLAPAIVPMFLNYALTHFIIARGRAWLNALFTVIVLIENLVINVLFVPRYGASGAAAALLVSEVTLLCLCALGFRYSIKVIRA